MARVMNVEKAAESRRKKAADRMKASAMYAMALHLRIDRSAGFKTINSAVVRKYGICAVAYVQEHPEVMSKWIAHKASKGNKPVKIYPKNQQPGPVKHIVGGVDVTSNEFLQTYDWRRVRMVALKKYGPRCQCCGASPADGAVMNVDHIKPRRLFPELALDVDNLQILCGECNHGKGNWDTTDWRSLDDASASHMREILA